MGRRPELGIKAVKFLIIGEVRLSDSRTHQTDGDLLDNTISCNDINMIENTGGMPGDDPGPSQWGPPINLGTFGDKRNLVGS